MSEDLEQKLGLEKYLLPDGREIFIIEDEAEALALKEIIKDRLWFKETTRRAKRVFWLFGAMMGFLGFLATQWPLISKIIQVILTKDSAS